MMLAPALICEFDGEVLRPIHPKRAAERFETGKRYQIEVVESRSAASHAHFFACVADAWANLPESEASRFPSPDHLRRWALIKAGYYTERCFVCASKAEALGMASFVRPLDEFAVVVVKGNIVALFSAKSQSHRAMAKDEFQASKDGALAVIAELIGVTPAALAANAGERA